MHLFGGHGGRRFLQEVNHGAIHCPEFGVACSLQVRLSASFLFERTDVHFQFEMNFSKPGSFYKGQ